MELSVQNKINKQQETKLVDLPNNLNIDSLALQKIIRVDGRAHNQLRPLSLIQNISGNAHGSVLLQLGNTKVLCSVIIQDGVPSFLRGKNQGWLTAEYSMLPGATRPRTVRDSSQAKKDGRSVEISRLIGRSLRAIVDLKKMGERTIFIDCDVIQADGGTRTVAITGAYYALLQAIANPVLFSKNNLDLASLITDSLGAISVGWSNNQALLDINFEEDTTIDADFNFVMTGSGKIIEIQGATEKKPIDWQSVQNMQVFAHQGIVAMLKSLDQLKT